MNLKDSLISTKEEGNRWVCVCLFIQCVGMLKCKTLPCLLCLLKTAFNPFQKFICGSVHLDIPFLPSLSHKPGEDRTQLTLLDNLRCLKLYPHRSAKESTPGWFVST